MLTLVDKSLLVKIYYLSLELTAEILRRFLIEKKMKKWLGPITNAGSISFIRRFEEIGCLQNRPRRGAPRLSEVRTSSLFSQMTL